MRPPKNPSHPGELLKRVYLDEMGVTQTKLAEMTGYKQTHISEVINGRRNISPEFAIALEKALKVSADMWVNAQATYDLWTARQKAKKKAS